MKIPLHIHVHVHVGKLAVHPNEQCFQLNNLPALLHASHIAFHVISHMYKMVMMDLRSW